MFNTYRDGWFKYRSWELKFVFVESSNFVADYLVGFLANFWLATKPAKGQHFFAEFHKAIARERLDFQEVERLKIGGQKVDC